MLDYAKVRNWHSGDVRHTYTAKDVKLYALGVGVGQDPMDREQLHYVVESDELRVLPSMAAVLASPGFWMRNHPELGIDHVRLVHGEQSVMLHRPLPPGGSVIGRTRVTGVVDKGAGKGALVQIEKTIVDADSGNRLATCESVVFCRGDGGFSAKGGGDPAPAAPLPTPDTRRPDLTLEFQTRQEAALIYRLSGDLNPLHADPEIAAQAGFPRPILHGLATYGVACHGLLKAYCGYDATNLESMSARFSSPTYPGDALQLECWTLDEEIAFRVRVPNRDVTVLSHGRARCIRETLNKTPHSMS